MTIRNPILKGFNPDPSICRKGDTFYIATSTFEWFPGVQLFSSTDLKNWSFVTHPLTRPEQLDMRGNPDSCGVWAPCLSYSDGLFWLVYTDVKRYDGNYKDTHNYLVTAPDIDGPWSDPVYLNSRGFDPSLFHDDDGKKYLLNIFWDYRASRGRGENNTFFGGVLIQEYSAQENKLTGETRNIFKGSPLGCTEGPHLYKRNGWYYLITAEGGTGYSHAVTHARSRSILGDYELHPQSHPVTAKDRPEAKLQRTGHGQFVDINENEAVHTFLCSRPLPGTRFSTLGREGCAEILEWREDDWLYRKPDKEEQNEDPVTTPSNSGKPGSGEKVVYDFMESSLPLDFQWLRTPHHERLFSLTAKPGCLRLYGRESIGSWFEQSLVARRQTSHCYSAETEIDYTPKTPLHLAGLTTYYNRHQFYYLYLSVNDNGDRILDIQGCIGDWPEATLIYPLSEEVSLPEGSIGLGVDVHNDQLQFRYSTEPGNWTSVGPVLDASILSDEAGRGMHANFTGAFVGVAAQDLGGQALCADFASFSYLDLDGEQNG